jgi:hypothetical protein
MSSIPGIAYLLIGSVVAGFSRFVELKSNQRMGLFFYAGILFAIIGVGKIIFTYINTKNKPKTHNTTRPNTNMQNQTNPRSTQNQFGRTQVTNNHTQNSINRPAQHHRPTQTIHHITPNPTHSHQPSKVEHPSIIPCPSCGIKHYAYANYCMMCGQKIKRT